MTGTSSISSTNYTTPKKVYEFLGTFTEIPITLDASGNKVGNESVGTGNSSITRFALDNRNVIPGTDHVFVGTTENTAYTVDEDNGFITFTNAPTASAITAAYRYADIPSTAMADFILRAEGEIDRRTGRVFLDTQTAVQYYDGMAKGLTNLFSYQATRFTDDVNVYIPKTNDLLSDKYLQTENYPIQSIALLALNEYKDQAYEDTRDSYSFLGGVNCVSQSFTCGYSKPLVRAAILLKYSSGTAAAITVELQSDSAGVPSGTVLASSSITATTRTNFENYDVVFSQPYSVVNGTKYHLVFKATTSGTNAYQLGIVATSPTYSGGSISTSTNSGSAWTADSAKDAVFSTYVADDVADYSEYRVDKTTGRIVLTRDSGLKFSRGVENVVLVYTYGYPSVPKVIEEIATKLAAIGCIESTLLGRPVPLVIPEGNVKQLREDLFRTLDSMGQRVEATIL